MARVVRFAAPRIAEVVEVDDPVAGHGDVLIETIYSGISAGTELTAYRGSNPYLSQRWDPERRLFVPDNSATLEYPLDGWGYEEVGRVADVGSAADEDLVGRLVWGAWGHRSLAVRPVDYVRPRLLPAGSRALSGVFAKIGAIALNAVLDADIHVGEDVVVFGAGVPGQITAQLARLNGGTVTVVDPVDSRRDLAERLGAARTLSSATDVAAETRSATGNRGADVVIEMSGSYLALQEAVRTAGYSSRVVAAGFFQGDGTALRLGAEFHHNRVSIVGSQISGVAPHLQHRWDELRMSNTALRLERDGLLRLDDLVTHVLHADEAPAALHMLDTGPEEAMQVILDYGVEL